MSSAVTIYIHGKTGGNTTELEEFIIVIIIILMCLFDCVCVRSLSGGFELVYK